MNPAVYELYVQPFSGPGGKWQISTGGGNWPLWARRGLELFYLNGSKMNTVPALEGFLQA
jgi:hypothetical protein